MDRYISIGKAAESFGVSIATLRRWERSGKLKPYRTKNNHRRYKLSEMSPGLISKVTLDTITIAYARVSSNDQKADLDRQKQLLEMYCASQGWQFKVIADLGSGMNYNKRGLKELLSIILDGNISRLVLTHKDRLLRFGAELVFSLCERRGVEVVIINKGDEPSFEEDLAKDVLELITVFSARLYGSRSKKNKKLLENLKEAAGVVSS